MLSDPLYTTLRLDLVSLAPGKELVVSHLRFRNIKYVAIYLDGLPVPQADARFEDSWLVWPELANSAKQSGRYLLFTSLTGIADEGGWDYIQVLHEQEYVEWLFFRDEQPLCYRFDKQAYVVTIQQMEQVLAVRATELPLEPLHVIFPEV